MRLVHLSLLVIVVFSLLGSSGLPAEAAPLMPAVNVFGYTVTSHPADTYAWIDATGGTKLFGANQDDESYASAIPLGFSFPFFGTSYSQVYVNMNGVISFNSNILGKSTELARNSEIPFDYEIPQNFLAPYWDDLHTFGVTDPNAGVYALQGPGNSYFVIEWRGVLVFGTSQLLTETISCEAVLFPNGDILFQYQDLGATFQTGTVGIEDADGLDGEQVLYNQPLSGEDILITYPAPQRRVKAYPQEQSGFNVGGTAWYPVQIQNLSDASLGSDSYRLTLEISSPGWAATLYQDDGVTLLKDDDGDGFLETGLLAPLQSKTIKVKVSAPTGVDIGEETWITLTATSEAESTKQAVAQIRSVVPAAFVQIYRSSQLFIDFFAPGFRFLSAADTLITGGVNSFAVVAATAPYYLSAWSKTRSGPAGEYTNIEYILQDDFGLWQFAPARVLVDNNGTTIRDRDPALAVAPNGNLAIAWLREESCTDGGEVGFKNNIYLAILHPDGTPGVLPPTNITNNNYCSISGRNDMMSLQNLRLVEAGGNFHLLWVEQHYLYYFLKYTRDLRRSVYSATGALVRSPTYLFNYSPSDNQDYRNPALARVSLDGIGSKVMVVYSYETDLSSSLVYSLLDVEDGDLYPVGLQSWTALGVQNAFEPDLTQLAGGRIIIVFTESSSSQPAALLLNSDLSLATPAPISLVAPDGRRSGTASVSGTEQGQAVITWLDNFAGQRLYYALLDPNNLANPFITEPVIFSYAGYPSTYATNAGQGNASLLPRFRISAPLISK